MKNVFLYLILFVFIATNVVAGTILMKNCTDGSRISISKFNDDMTDYKILKKYELGPGQSMLWKLEPGTYCITYYNENKRKLSYEVIRVEENTKESVGYGCSKVKS